MTDFGPAIVHAGNFWFKPCQDDGVVTYRRYLDIRAEMRDRHLSEADWEAGFFRYRSGGGQAEGLFFITKSFAPTVQQRIAAGFSIDSVPDPRHFICSWRDFTKDDAIGQTPKYTGLNDCTHFVTECLSKARLPNIQTSDPAVLFDKLTKMGTQTKTLALMVGVETARRIINHSNVLKPGDVILFATTDHKHMHCGLYLGDRQVAQHTHINHSQDSTDQRTDPNTRKRNNWEVSANRTHPLVTVVHFNRQSDVPQRSFMPGWWKVTGGIDTMFYFFDHNGSVGKSRRVTHLSMPPPHPSEKGYWFEDKIDLTICWPKTGDSELYWPIIISTRLTGRLNGVDSLVAVKMT